jgi:hypothetical protein
MLARVRRGLTYAASLALFVALDGSSYAALQIPLCRRRRGSPPSPAPAARRLGGDGSPATSAPLNGPGHVKATAGGGFLIADAATDVVRFVDADLRFPQRPAGPQAPPCHQGPGRHRLRLDATTSDGRSAAMSALLIVRRPARGR